MRAMRDMAQEMGNSRVANTIMMGAFIKKTGIVSAEIYLKSLESIMGSKKNRQLKLTGELLLLDLIYKGLKNIYAVKQISVLLAMCPALLPN